MLRRTAIFSSYSTGAEYTVPSCRCLYVTREGGWVSRPDLPDDNCSWLYHDCLSLQGEDKLWGIAWMEIHRKKAKWERAEPPGADVMGLCGRSAFLTRVQTGLYLSFLSLMKNGKRKKKKENLMVNDKQNLEKNISGECHSNWCEYHSEVQNWKDAYNSNKLK